jgi:1-phosphatidylinositol phosphodiesterase
MTERIKSEQWMAHLDDGLRLSQIFLPGTHDSFAYHCNTLAACQSLTIEEQLRCGIRFIDVRCRHMNDEFRLYHSSFYLNKNFQADVLDKCVEFLRQNPSEVVLMLVSPEYREVQFLVCFV